MNKSYLYGIIAAVGAAAAIYIIYELYLYKLYTIPPPNKNVLTVDYLGFGAIACNVTTPGFSPVKYVWNFGIGNPPATATTDIPGVEFVYTDYGTYLIIMTATNSAGAVTIASATVTISTILP
ncbi:MAG: PKD domain-containing protein [Thermoplasmata archaeon]